MAVRKKSRHGTAKNVEKPTDPHPPISIGKKEKDLLIYLLSCKGSRLNIRSYSRLSNIPRPTIYDMLGRLIFKGLVVKPHLGNHKITEKGITTVELLKNDVGAVRFKCRKDQLSTHFLKYIMPIKNREKFHESLIEKIKPLKYKSNELPNFMQYFIYFEDATIIINLKKIIIRIHDIITEDTEEANYRSFNKAIKYAEKLERIGIFGEGLQLEKTHFARIESILADTLSKINKRFFVDLGKGRKFWIDSSPPNRIEDETNDLDVRERYDSFFRDLADSEGLISDIDKIVKALSYLTEIERVKMKRDIHKSTIAKEEIQKDHPTYFG